MTLRDYARVLRVRWRSIALLALVGLSAAFAASATTTPVYSASAQLFVTAGNQADNVSNAYTTGLFSQLRVKSYADIVTSPLVTRPVIDRYRLSLSEAQLASQISASAPLDTVLINVSVRDVDPARAVLLANAVSQQFTATVASLETTQTATSPPVKLTVVKPAGGAGQVAPRTSLNLALGLLVGLALGLGLAVVREQLDTRIKGGMHLRETLGLSTLGTIPFDSDAPSKPLTVQLGTHAPRTEAFRQVRTNLSFVDVDRTPRSLLVTSSVPGEGKSTTACNLALALAESGQRVLLIEGDLRRPKLNEYLGLVESVGLSDVLIGRVDLDDAKQPFGDTGRLDVLLSGPTPPNSAELLGSRHMADLMARCEKEYFVVVDAPPLLPVTDAAVLSRLVSGSVLVVRVGHTREDEVRQALQNLESVNARLYGAIVSMAPMKGPDARQHGYGYGYGYAPLDGAGHAISPVHEPVDQPNSEPSADATAAPQPDPPVMSSSHRISDTLREHLHGSEPDAAPEPSDQPSATAPSDAAVARPSHSWTGDARPRSAD